ncbi:MAG: peptide deformylase [Pseudoflavonifractor sp.]|nr:peptide deformylase [Pseudoflavonifractor sp.]
MAIREILTDKDPALHKKCHPVTQFDAKLGLLLDDLKETLAHANGAGLAAPQIGILRRVVVVVDGNDQMLELVNPEILTQEGEQDGLEGCLSVPGYYGFIKRPMKVRVKAQDRTGKWFEAEGEEIVARCFCHETEHLDGHVFTEHTDKLYSVDELDQLMEEETKQKRKGR